MVRMDQWVISPTYKWVYVGVISTFTNWDVGLEEVFVDGLFTIPGF